MFHVLYYDSTDDDVMWVFTTSTVTPSLRSVIDTAVARITCGLLLHDRGYVDVSFFFYYVICQYILFHVVCQYTLYYDSTYAMMMMSCGFVGLYDLDSDP